MIFYIFQKTEWCPRSRVSRACGGKYEHSAGSYVSVDVSSGQIVVVPADN